MARSLPGVPVVVGESRAAAGREALSRRCRRRLPPRRRVPAPVPGAGLRPPPGRLRERAREPADRAAGEAARAALPRAFRGRDGGDEMPGRGGGGKGRADRAASRGPSQGMFPAGSRGIVGRDGKSAGRDPARGRESSPFRGSPGTRSSATRWRRRDTGSRGSCRFPTITPTISPTWPGSRGSPAGLPAITTEKDLVRIPPDTPFPVGALARGGGIPVRLGGDCPGGSSTSLQEGTPGR